MTLQQAEKLTDLQQVTIMKDRWFTAATNLLDEHEATGDLKKGTNAASFSRVHRMYLREKYQHTSAPKKAIK